MAQSPTRRLRRLHDAVDRLRSREETELARLRAEALRLEQERAELYAATGGVGALSLYVDLLARRIGRIDGEIGRVRNAESAAEAALRAQERRMKLIERMTVAAVVQERREDERRALDDWLDAPRQASEKLPGGT
ncbi:MAG TPA: hypothetical protein VIL72_06140 [Beijerinckiaceae bacterium]|jgi:hypothetical protein